MSAAPGLAAASARRAATSSRRETDEALAREVVDDPKLFGLAWPVFGLAAALSTVVSARLFGCVNRLRVWAVSHLVMAIRIVMPSLCLTPGTIAIAALCFGSTFMVVTMIGMQEARARAPAIPRRSSA